MENNLVVIKGNELMVGTWNLSIGFKLEHRLIKRFIKKYHEDFKEFGFCITTQLQRQIIGNARIDEYLLTEEQATYLTMLLKNNDIVRSFKRHLNKEFFKQRKLLNQLIIQRQNEEWHEKRKCGKIERRLETDQIKKFIQYAKAQGSTNAEKYYMVISKMENNSLFYLEFLGQKYDNLREILDGLALDIVKMADIIVGKALKEGMERSMYYKDIYIMARDRVEGFALSMGKTPLRLILDKSSSEKLIADRS